jgi:hypothetical protein
MSIVFVLLVFFPGCGPVITDGKIINKGFIPAHDEDDSTSFQVDDVTITIPGTRHVPDQWTITFGKVVDDNTGKYVERTLYVTEDTYNHYKPGDWIFFNKE